jgi:hypothetical protein
LADWHFLKKASFRGRLKWRCEGGIVRFPDKMTVNDGDFSIFWHRASQNHSNARRKFLGRLQLLRASPSHSAPWQQPLRRRFAQLAIREPAGNHPNQGAKNETPANRQSLVTNIPEPDN